VIFSAAEQCAFERVERASRELHDAQLALADLLDPDAAEVQAFVLHADDGPRLRVIDGGRASMRTSVRWDRDRGNRQSS